MEWDVLRGEESSGPDPNWIILSRQANALRMQAAEDPLTPPKNTVVHGDRWSHLQKVLSKVVKATHPVRWLCLFHILDVHSPSFLLKNNKLCES